MTCRFAAILHDPSLQPDRHPDLIGFFTPLKKNVEGCNRTRSLPSAHLHPLVCSSFSGHEPSRVFHVVKRLNFTANILTAVSLLLDAFSQLSFCSSAAGAEEPPCSFLRG
jgi:hypothetical protein